MCSPSNSLSERTFGFLSTSARRDTLVELKRSGDGWVVASLYDWPTKADRVNDLLDDVTGLSGELRSSRSDVLADFQIDDEGGFHLVGEAGGGSELFHLVVGKNSPRGGSFVRAHGSDDVYLTSAAFRSSFGLWGDDPTPPEGKRWDNRNLRRSWARCLDASGIRQVRFHDLRHTFASALAQQGAPPKYVQSQLGHSSLQVTMDVYSPLFEKRDRGWVNRLDEPANSAALEAKSATQPQPLVPEATT